MQIQSVNLGEVIAAARAKHASLVPESAGYLMLSLGRAMAGLPLAVELHEIHLSSDGGIVLAGPRNKIDLQTAALRMKRMLERLLEVAQGAPTPLRGVVEMELDRHNPLERLFTAITKALIPLNRAAAKRALARLARETLRMKARGIVLPTESDVEASATTHQTVTPEPALVPAADTPAVLRASPTPVAPIAEAPTHPAARGANASGATDDDEDDIDVDFELASVSPRPIRIDLATPTPPPHDDEESAPGQGAFETDEPHAEPTPTVVDASATRVAATPPEDADSRALQDVLSGFATNPATSSEYVVAIIEDRDSERVSEQPARASEPQPATEAELQDAIGEVVDQLSKVLGAVVELREAGERVAEAACEPMDAAGVAVGQDAMDEEDANVAEQDSRNDAHADGSRDEPSPMASREWSKEEQLEVEAALAERLTAASAERGRLGRRERGRGKRPSRIKERVLEQKDDALLARFGGDDEEDAIRAVQASLSDMMALDLPQAQQDAASNAVDSSSATGQSAPTTAESAEPFEVDVDVGEPELEPSTLTPPELPGSQSIAPSYLSRPPRRAARAPIWISAGLLLSGVCAAAYVYLGGHGRMLFAGAPSSALGTSETTAPSERCTATLALRDLPTPHEVLVGLGRAPTMTRPLPTGVRLELVALAPNHQPQRLVVAPDASWRDEAGNRILSLHAELEQGTSAAWPAAPEGETGGVGVPGRIGFEATPADTELWLVVAAGEGTRTDVTVPCDETANILVVKSDEPSLQRRASIDTELLKAAAEMGPAELSLAPERTLGTP